MAGRADSVANVQSHRARLAVDIGGTFTDAVLELPHGRFVTKVLTTPQQPEQGVMTAIRKILSLARARPADIGLFVHGTTLATNALIERKGARCALLTTQGMRDILELGFEKRAEQYDVYLDKAPALVPRALRFEVPERISAAGNVLLALDENALRQLVEPLRATGIESLAIGFIHAWRNADHEQRARDLLAPLLPGVSICLSSEVCPQLREYERFSTTVANAYVRPLMSGYLVRLREQVGAAGLNCPLFLMLSGGGLTTLEQATRFPIRLLESGPAGGAIFAAGVASRCGLPRALSFDMGGTTAKIALIENGVAERAASFEAARQYRDVKGSGLPIRVPSIEMVEIGAGGGSIATVDAMQRIQVGPASAGADPGPACYGRGGTEATVTDANLVLGKLDPALFAGGSIELHANQAHDALTVSVGKPLGLDAHWPAVAVAEIVEENMANAARVHAIERGKSISQFAMVAYGGGAPLHAGRLAQKLGISTVVVPRGAGVGSAIGFLRAPVAYEVVRSLTLVLDRINPSAANQLLAQMQTEADAIVRANAGAGAPVSTRREVTIRYVGQGHDLAIQLPDGPLDAQSGCALRAQFEKRYRQTYGLTITEMAAEAVSWSLTSTLLSGEQAEPAPAAVDNRQTDSSRLLYDMATRQLAPSPCHWRDSLREQDVIIGPAIIAENETAVVVPAGFSARVVDGGHLMLQADENVTPSAGNQASSRPNA